MAQTYGRFEIDSVPGEGTEAAVEFFYLSSVFHCPYAKSTDCFIADLSVFSICRYNNFVVFVMKEIPRPQQFFPVHRNLVSLYIIKVAKWMNLVMPIIVLFYKSNGLTMQDIFTLQAVFSATLMVLEIPTGYFADVAGRRNSLLAGAFLGSTGFLIYCFSHGFWEFVVAETILGIGVSLVSGADSAMLYDSLASAGKKEKYLRYEGRIVSIGNFAEAIAGITGGMLAVSSLRTPFYFQAAVAFIAIPAALCLIEPPIRTAARKPGFRDIREIIRTVLFLDRKLFWNTLFSGVIGVSTLTMAWFAQPFFLQMNLQVSLYGVVWAFLNLSVGIAAMYAWRIESRLGAPGTVLLFTLPLMAGYFGLACTGSWIGLLILLVFYLARGLATPVLRNYVNVIASSDIRATVLSIRSFIIRGVFALLGPLFGLVTDRYSLSTALLMAGMIFTALSGITLFFFLKHRTYEQ